MTDLESFDLLTPAIQAVREQAALRGVEPVQVVVLALARSGSLKCAGDLEAYEAVKALREAADVLEKEVKGR